MIRKTFFPHFVTLKRSLRLALYNSNLNTRRNKQITRIYIVHTKKRGKEHFHDNKHLIRNNKNMVFFSFFPAIIIKLQSHWLPGLLTYIHLLIYTPPDDTTMLNNKVYCHTHTHTHSLLLFLWKRAHYFIISKTCRFNYYYDYNILIFPSTVTLVDIIMMIFGFFFLYYVIYTYVDMLFGLTTIAGNRRAARKQTEMSRIFWLFANNDSNFLYIVIIIRHLY